MKLQYIFKLGVRCNSKKITFSEEIDYVEETAGAITGYEIKWNTSTKVKFPKLFKETYRAKSEIITRENYRTFL